MCGIAGALNARHLDKEAILESMRHRGPDASGHFNTEVLNKPIDFFHTRLSIQDLSPLANQPMIYKHLCITFNGEVYNHLPLRKLTPNFPYKTHSDTETLLALYLEFGECFLEKLPSLDGMFAFVILDSQKNQMVLGRDRVGKKPLFFWLDSESEEIKFAFSSELNTLKKICPHLQIDYSVLSLYVRGGFYLNDVAPFAGVESLLPSHYGIFDLQSLTLKQIPYFSLKETYESPKISNLQDCLDQVESALAESINSRLLSSDVEVGAFLSGGIDSSLIVALASKIIEKPLRTFTVKFSGSYDESPLAQLVADKFNTQHEVLSITPNLANDVESILKFYGRPFMDSSAIPSFYVSRSARKYVKVALNGDGADEFFGGYRRYVAHMWLGKVLKLPQYIRSLIINPALLFGMLFPKTHEKKSLLNYSTRLLAMAKELSCENYLGYYLRATTDIFEGYYEVKDTFGVNMAKAQEFITNIFTNDNFSHLSKALFLDTNILLLSDLLPKMDIATMANSLEVRSPFLGISLLNLAPTLADDLKIKGKVTKYILRTLAQKHLPSALVDAPKRGFEVPLKQWVENELKEPIYDRLQNPKISQTFIDISFIQNLLEKPLSFPREKRAKMLWNLFALEVWADTLEK